MDQNAIAALVALIKTGGFVNVSCQREYNPPVVEIDLPAMLSITLPYDTYQQVREAAGLPEGVCDDSDEA